MTEEGGGMTQEARSSARNRISRVVTRTGDGGETALADGKRRPKHHPRFELIGAIDEANSFIGLLAASLVPGDHRQRLTEIQSRLFDIGGGAATGVAAGDWGALTAAVEDWTKTMNAGLPPLREFVLPGGAPAVALAHVARSMTRRAERKFWAQAEALPALAEAGMGAYLNRLSDYLFVLARVIAREQTAPETTWVPLGRDQGGE